MSPKTTSRARSTRDSSAPALSREAIVEHALRLADSEGLDAVSLRRIAQDLGVTPMALYWHVANKDELLAAMGDRLFAELRLEVDASATWQAQLRTLVEDLLTVLRSHPGAVSLAGPRILQTGRGQQLSEMVLSLLASAGFSVEESSAIARHLMLTAVAMVNEGIEVECIGLAADERALMMSDKYEALQTLPVDQFPHLLAASSSLVSWEAMTARYAYGIDLVMAGIDHLAPKS